MSEPVEAVAVLRKAPAWVVPAPRPETTSAETGPGRAPAAEAAPAPVLRPHVPAVRVEVSMSSGMQTVTIYDLSSGQAIYQAPLEHTRHVLDKLAAAPQQVGTGRTSGNSLPRR